MIKNGKVKWMERGKILDFYSSVEFRCFIKVIDHSRKNVTCIGRLFDWIKRKK